MKKITYQKAADGLLIFALFGYIFAIHPDLMAPVEALNDDKMVFDPECIIAIDDDVIVIAQ